MVMKAKVAVIGGSGMYDPQMLQDPESGKVFTPYGSSSALVTVGKLRGIPVAFLPRHGERHVIPPHLINYRANIWALKELGVERVIAPSAVGSLQNEYEPGDLVIPDQFVDRTWGREGSFYGGGQVSHISMADPFCNELAGLTARAAERLGVKTHRKGTYVCIQGPRFSTRAESRLFRTWGAQIIGMTLIPEVTLAREARICYQTIAMVTDYDVWAEKPVTAEEVMKTMHSNVNKVRTLLAELIPSIPEQRSCHCGKYLDEALI